MANIPKSTASLLRNFGILGGAHKVATTETLQNIITSLQGLESKVAGICGYNSAAHNLEAQRNLADLIGKMQNISTKHHEAEQEEIHSSTSIQSAP
ncbi:hypothetical protein [Legionella jordanis]|uniref:Uncharacterized protein n=1 Tax=Legionella jordanis TaxID=456 RepID=Q49J89_9GAMM|nr:hypothetical protein [Legionella jordanis]AAX56188.1 unknown [Legionella jordanis]KTD18363.1 hypothetical protein Ljor_2669 [Legionella jordanis]RMX05274.1 hypothetical protein EAW55_01015 [Legionella jordanis]RMX20875.1 hypothetical protein EAS68_06030 [Legionella jordanis]VEH13291.1 Uncharacterised protein [Legionella jordanis]